MNEHEAPVWCCAFHPLVPLLASGGGDRIVRLWRMDGECLRVLRGHSEWVYSLSFSPSGELLVSASFDGSLRVWDVSNGKCVRVMRAGGINFLACSFDPLGTFIAAASSDKLIRFFRLSDGEVSRTLRGHEKEVTCLSFHPSDRLLASGSLDCSLRLWSTKSGEQLRVLGGRAQAKVWCCSFSPSGHLLASGGSDSVIRLWRVEDGEVVSSLSGHRGAVRTLAFDARGGDGGELLISGEGNLMWGSDNSVRVWGPVERGDRMQLQPLQEGERWKWRCLAVVLGHGKMITNVALPPDGSFFASSSRDGSVRLWSV
uniref:Anaphase-promoting complex subunit 4 WD40 domain-containing protein n=1 Tax=Guillardia theta (strain CCMP2712) TaxID=905079 RepID=A0A0C3TKW7_GUITC